MKKKITQKRNTSLTLEGLRREDLVHQYLIIGLLLFLALGLPIIIYIPLREWCAYNLLYRPFYFLFSGSFYVAFFIEFFKIALSSLIAGAIMGAVVWVIMLYVFKMMIVRLRLKITVGMTAAWIFFLFTFGVSYIKDFNCVLQGKYCIEESYLYKIQRKTTKSRHHPHLDTWVGYVLFTNTLDERYSESELNYIENDIADQEEYFFKYKPLDLNVYQYFDLKRRYAVRNLSDSAKINVYYLPNTKMVLNYDLKHVK